MRFIIVQPTHSLPYFLYVWTDSETRWLARRDLAKRFTRREATQIVNQLNARSHVNPAQIELARNI